MAIADFLPHVLVFSVALLLLLQGGYYELPSLAVASFISGAAIYACRHKAHFAIPTFVLAPIEILALALVSAFLSGYGSYSLVKAAPYVAISAASLCAVQIRDDSKSKFVNLLCLLGLVSSALAIIFYVAFPAAFGFVSNGRLQAFFQYANTAAVWFAVATILLLAGGGKKALTAIVPAIALLLTKSVSVICLFCLVLLYLLFSSPLPKRKKVLFASIALLAGCIVLFVLGPSRISEASQTFIERAIQWHDGLKSLVGSPLFGIGPGAWRYEYLHVQSALYTARVIHNGYLQVGLDAGILTLLLFCVWIVRGLIGLARTASSNQEARFVFCAAMLLALHLFLDIDLAFGVIDLLLGVLMTFGVAQGSHWKQSKLHKRLFGLSAGLFALACASLCLIAFVRMLPQTNPPSGIFSTDPELRCNYANELCENEEFEPAIAFIEEKTIANTTDLLVLEAGARYCLGNRDGGEKLLLELVSAEPFNFKLYDLSSLYFRRYGVSDSGASRFEELEREANARLSQYPAALLANQEYLSYEVG